VGLRIWIRSSGERGVAVVHLESVGHVADATHVKYTRELRVGHGQRKAREREVWAVRAIPGIFHAHVRVKTRHEKQVRATSRTGKRRFSVRADMPSVAR